MAQEKDENLKIKEYKKKKMIRETFDRRNAANFATCGAAAKRATIIGWTDRVDHRHCKKILVRPLRYPVPFTYR